MRYASEDPYWYRIYKLVNPVDNSVFYVGITQCELYMRLRTHISNSRAKEVKTKVSKYIRDLMGKNIHPKIELIIEGRSIRSLEYQYIKEYAKKYDLKNVAGLKTQRNS